jgi:hypothetical protein
MATFADYYTEIKSYVPDLPINLSKRIVNRARREIYAERPWTFLLQFARLTTPALINTGEMTVTPNSTTVMLDAAAQTALSGLVNPFITRRQLKFSSTDLIYNIAAFNGVDTIELDIPFFSTIPGPQQTGYSCFQAYYSPPSTDFLRWISVVDLANAHELDLLKVREQIDRWDPQRTSTGEPVCIVQFRAVPPGFWDASVNVGDPLYEIWPTPTAARVYSVLYQRRGAEFTTDTDTLPSTIPDDLLLVKSRIFAYEWQLSNDPSFINAYRTLVPSLEAKYRDDLRRAKVQDDEIFITQWVPRMGPKGLRWFDSNYAQDHAVPGPAWGY